MNKQELIDAILANKEAGIESKAAAARALDAVLDGIAAGIKKDGNVQLIGFGTFSVKARAARTGRNPQTGATIKIKASKQQEQLMAPIQQKIQTAIQAVGTENGFTFIFPDVVPVYTGATVVDVTPMVKAKLGVK